MYTRADQSLTQGMNGGGFNCPTKRGRRPFNPMVRWKHVSFNPHKYNSSFFHS
jgi:hypothetical protein